MEVDPRSEAPSLRRESSEGLCARCFPDLHCWRVVFSMAVVRHLWALLSCSYSQRQARARPDVTFEHLSQDRN